MASRKQFQDLADAVVSRFVSRNNDIGGFWGVGVLSRHLHEADQDCKDFDLLGTGDPLDGGSATWLQTRLLATATPPGWLAIARLRVTFEKQSMVTRVASPWWMRFLPVEQVQSYRAIVTATLVDDHGRTREATEQTWCWDQARTSD